MGKRGPKSRSRLPQVCVICGGRFVAGRDPRQTCGAEACRRALIRRRRAEQPAKPITWHTRRCVVCGREYRQTGAEYHTSGRTTCGPGCSAALAGDNARRRLARWTPETRARQAAARLRHPRTGPGADNAAARDYDLRDPEGVRHTGRNLALFVRERFGGDPAAYFGLARLRPGRVERRRSWHGWTWAE